MEASYAGQTDGDGNPHCLLCECYRDMCLLPGRRVGCVVTTCSMRRRWRQLRRRKMLKLL